MKKVLLAVLSLVVLASCKKDKDNDPSPSSAGQGYVKPAAVGKWLHGSFAMASFWGYDGSYQGNPFSQSIAFDFKSNGSYEMYYTGQTNDFGCTRDAFSYFKGYAQFTDSSFTVYPQSGKFRGYYSCNSSANFDRTADASELKVQKFYYTFETDANNKTWMVVKFDPAEQTGSYFGPTTW